MKFSLKLFITWIALGLVYGPAVNAESLDPSPADQQFAGEDLLFQNIDSVYSASKYEQKVTEAPSSVSIITAEEIKKHGYRNFSEILQSIRGFYVTNDRNFSYLGIRGFGLPSDYSNRVLILLEWGADQ